MKINPIDAKTQTPAAVATQRALTSDVPLLTAAELQVEVQEDGYAWLDVAGVVLRYAPGGTWATLCKETHILTTGSLEHCLRAALKESATIREMDPSARLLRALLIAR